MTPPPSPRTRLIACGALATELRTLLALHGLDSVAVECLPARLHNTPDFIADAVAERARAALADGDRVVVGYADCGTGGRLDAVCAELGIERLPGAHCYELFAGREAFAELHEAEPGTFYLTDYLARHFERLVIRGLGIDRHPELAELYFANYRRVVLLAQTGDPDVEAAARRAADRLGLELVIREATYGDLGASLVAVVEPTRMVCR